MSEVTDIRDQLAEAVRDAGKIALPKFGAQFRSWLKDKSSPVSEVDIAVDEMLYKRLTGVAPSYGWLSEETADDPSRLNARRVWIVDPIDGTRAFIGGLREWTIVAALVEDGRPVAGAVFAPALELMYTAARGAGAQCNGAPISVNDADDVTSARVAGPKNYLSAIAALGSRVEMLPKIHSLALRISRVAEGSVDVAFASANSHDWDLAAADLLVHEAGGLLTTLSGQALKYNGPRPIHDPLVAAGRRRHAALLHVFRETRPHLA